MKLFSNLKISSKIVILTTVLSLVFLGLPIIFIILNIKEQLIDQSLVSEKIIVEAESLKITAVTEEVVDTVFSLGGTPPIQGMFRALENDNFDEIENSTYEQWRNRLSVIFSSEINISGLYDQLRYIDENGQEIVRVNMVNSRAEIVPTNKLQYKGDRQYFIDASKLDYPELYVSKVDLNREGQPPQIEIPYKPVIRYAVSVFDTKGNRRGIIIANVLFNALVDRTNFLYSQKKNFVLIDSYGYYIVHPDENKLWGSPSDLGTDEKAQKDYPDVSNLIFEKNSGVIIDNNTVISYSKAYPNPNNKEYHWIALKKFPVSELLSSINRLITFAFFITFVVFILSFVIFIFGIKKILAPLNKLSIVAQKIGEEDFSQRANINTNDEIGFLANTLNKTAEKLKNSYSYLQRKIDNRTKALQKNVDELEETQIAMVYVLKRVSKEKEKLDIMADDLKKFKLAVDNVSEHIIITDIDAKVIYANQAVEKITGFTQKEIIGKNPSLWGKQMEDDFYKNFWKTIKEDKKIFSGEITNKRKNGEIYTAVVQVVPILNKKNEVIFFVGLERDVTQEREVDKAKTEFVSLASHQLRTPLTSIGWYAEMLLSGDAGRLTKKQKIFIDEIYQGNKRMSDLVGALLNVSRIELGTFPIDPELIDLKKISKRIIKELKPLSKEKKIKISEKYNMELTKVNVDPKLIGIVFQNLLSNALKYTPEKGKINLSITQQGTYILVKVEDNGYGIPVKEQDKIFQKLYRAQNVQAKDVEGTGLGLYIIKSIVETGGGKIWFESVENKGTIFHVTIPLSGMKAKKGTKRLN